MCWALVKLAFVLLNKVLVPVKVISWVGKAYPSVELGENSQLREDPPPPIVPHVVALVRKAEIVGP